MGHYKKGTASYSLIVTGLSVIMAILVGKIFDSIDAAILAILFVLLILGAAIRFNQK